MIRRALNSHWLCIGQPEHARLAGAMAEAWGRTPFLPPEPRTEVLQAVAEHDNGWAEWEAAPGLDPAAGCPVHFTEMSVADHLVIWRRGVQRMLERNPYAGLLVSMHGAALMRFRLEKAARTPEADRAAVRTFLAEQERLQAALREGLAARSRYREAVARARLTANFRLLQLLDALSLLLCCGATEPQTFPAVPLGEGLRRTDLEFTPEAGGAALRPYPFTETPGRFSVTGRLLPATRLPDPAALHAAWARAPERGLTFTLRSGNGGA
ncbi:MAG TPA: DUF3891 family protein [Candidatus Methylomirabilis sp.]|nr:DUF3891 family protein [Candidatus Methylomirabilis sp.]